jgi:phosphate transport system protein
MKCDESLCESVISDDSAVDELEKQVDQDGFDIILRFQPVAGDLRQVLAAMRACKDLERIGDLAVSISRKACQIQTYGARPEATLIEPLFDLAVELFSDAMRAYAQRDMSAANSVILRDKHLDSAHREATGKLVEHLQASAALAPYYVNMLFIVRHLERVSDHAVNLAEQSCLRGVFKGHSPLSPWWSGQGSLRVRS